MVLIESERTDFEPRKRARRRALQALYQWQATGQSSRAIIDQFLEEQDMTRVDVSYFESLVNEVAAGHAQLDERLSGCLDRNLAQVDSIERAVLRLAAHELLNHPEIPYRVIINEAVNLASRFGSQGGNAFVNGVLDRAAREWRAKTDVSPSDPST